MSYSVKEMYYTLQGEGFHSGRAAVFLRFAGCNLWNGREKDRLSAICSFCDTDFVGTNGPNGGTFKSETELAESLNALWPSGMQNKFVVCTGGEPLLQLDAPLIDALHKMNFEIAVETNGTMLPPEGIDWICVSPKGASNVVLTRGDEMKFVYPQKEITPQNFAGFDFSHYYIQPLDGPFYAENLQLSLQFCMQNPRWKLSLQTHKIINIP